MSDPSAAIRQFAFDIVMSELGLDESDPDDQEFVSEAVDAWMQHWDKTGARSEVASACPTEALIEVLVERGVLMVEKRMERLTDQHGNKYWTMACRTRSDWQPIAGGVS